MNTDDANPVDTEYDRHRFLRLRSTLLWVDCSGGLAVGIVVLACSVWLADLYRLPLSMIAACGAVNLLYGLCSLQLAVRRQPAAKWVFVLAIANMVWAIVCFGLTVFWWSMMSVPAAIHLMGEGVYVGALGAVEYRIQKQLSDSEQ